MKYFYIFTLVLSYPVSAQQINLTTGIGSYAMTDLKDYGQNLLEYFPVDVRYVEKFPPYWYYEISVSQPIDKYYVGGVVSYGSSGGRVNYTDYSGSITMDQNVRYLELGVQSGVILNPQATSGAFKFEIRPVVTFGWHDLIFSSRIGNHTEKEQFEFKSTNIGLQPGFSYSKKIFRSFALQIYAGYNLNVYKGKLFLKEDDSLFLQNDAGEKVSLDWSGFRGGLGITMNLKQ